jgi:hypothetical protein
LLLEQIEVAAERIWLTSPFVTLPIARQIGEAAGRSSAHDRRLLTALDPISVRVGVLDPKALALLRDAGFQIASVANLHAKVSIVDSNWSLVGSGNLTGAGLGGADGGNYELGVTLSEAQIDNASAIVSAWWIEAAPVSDEDIERYESLPKLPRPPIDAYGPTLPFPPGAGLAQVLAEGKEANSSRQYWIKSNYHRQNEEAWWRQGWISDWRKAPYGKGDLIVLYLSTRDAGPGNCPAVVEATSKSRHDPQWVIEHRDADAADRWPYVTRTSLVEEVPVSSGLPLALMGKSGRSLQGGYCSISWDEFERFARAMLAAKA